MTNDFTIAILDRVLDYGMCVIFLEARVWEYFCKIYLFTLLCGEYPLEILSS